MKTLIVGMDGAQLATFKRGWTPFIESLIEKGSELRLKEDLLSRGWAEIFTGEHGVNTGALYDRPVLDGGVEWSLKFKIADIPSLGTRIKPIWQILNERGYRVGIMNVPVTFPAPTVDGFFVSGGGGGTKVVQDPTEDLCYPKEVLKTLLDIGYIVDERIGSLVGEKKLYDARKIFTRLEKKNKKRTESFIKLYEDDNVDFGFLVYRTSSVMAEQFILPEWDKYLRGGDNVDHELVQAIKHYYQEFDSQIKCLAARFTDAEIILVSDHSMVTTQYLVNLNTFLTEHNYQQQVKKSSKIKMLAIDQIKKILKPFIPFSVRNSLRERVGIKLLQDNLIVFDLKNTSAFCMPMGNWSTGIYINDKERFNGIVESKNRVNLANKISLTFNNSQQAKRHHLKSHVKLDDVSPSSCYFPDIIVDCPDGYLVSNNSPEFMSAFKMPNGPIGIKQWLNHYKPYCVKGHCPIAITTDNWSVSSAIQKQDLRLIYDHILNIYT